MESEFCMKCGRELKPGTVFCDGCRAEMEKYPVKPGIVVLLPNQHNTQPKPAPRRKHPAIPVEEQVAKLKKRIISLWIALVLALAVVGGLGWYAVTDLLEEKEVSFLPGQNYSSQSTAETTSAE